MDRYSLDLWGGFHVFDNETQTYTIRRDCGLFSNITIMTYGIFKFYNNGYKPKNLKMYLTEYDTDIDFYDHLFIKSTSDYNFNNFSQDDIEHFLKFCEPNFLGIGRRKSDINFNILNIINKKFFNPSKYVQDIIYNIVKQNNINYKNTVFIWARKTDKINEVSIPTVDTYINTLKSLNINNMNVIVQSDDISVYEEFNFNKFEYINLNILPLSNNNNLGFHNNLCRMTDREYLELYKHTKIEYLQRLLALIHIASKCEIIILYPGNLTTYIPIIRQNWENVYSFIDNTQILK
jgi:hypothetical protein